MSKKKTKTSKTPAPTPAEPAVETAAETTAPVKAKKERAPKVDRSSWKTFAFRWPASESAALHAASGSAGASRFARIVLNAFTNEDEGAFKNAIAEARKLRA